MYFTYLKLPNLPKNLISELSDIIQKKNIFTGKSENYTLYELLNRDLTDEIAKIFPFKVNANYQIISSCRLGIHKDIDRLEAFNYLIKTGSGITKFYDEDCKTVLFEKKIKPFRWHYLDVSKFHSVNNLNGIRLSITVRPLIINSIDKLLPFIDPED